MINNNNHNNKNNSIRDEDDNEYNDDDINSNYDNNENNSPYPVSRLLATLNINGKPIKGIVDSSFLLSILWSGVAKQLNLQVIPKRVKFTTAYGQEIYSIGFAELLLRFQDKVLNDSCIFGLSVLKNVDSGGSTSLNIHLCRLVTCILSNEIPVSWPDNEIKYLSVL
ncbi:hypothetical protein ACTFIW_004256 [Dictyostelium discoideum]